MRSLTFTVSHLMQLIYKINPGRHGQEAPLGVTRKVCEKNRDWCRIQDSKPLNLFLAFAIPVNVNFPREEVAGGRCRDYVTYFPYGISLPTVFGDKYDLKGGDVM